MPILSREQAGKIRNQLSEHSRSELDGLISQCRKLLYNQECFIEKLKANPEDLENLIKLEEEQVKKLVEAVETYDFVNKK